MNSLAPYNRIYNMFVPIVILIGYAFIFNLIYSNIDDSNLIEGLLILLGIPLILTLWLFFAFKTFNIYYDYKTLILRSFRKEIWIPKENIKRLKLTLSNLDIFGWNFLNYRIEYINNTDSKASVNFWITAGSARLNDFISNLPDNTIIEHKASTFNN